MYDILKPAHSCPLLVPCPGEGLIPVHKLFFTRKKLFRRAAFFLGGLPIVARLNSVCWILLLQTHVLQLSGFEFDVCILSASKSHMHPTVLCFLRHHWLYDVFDADDSLNQHPDQCGISFHFKFKCQRWFRASQGVFRGLKHFDPTCVRDLASQLFSP